MANTSNFGWETPDDTDLVKDGALAIRTLGSSIDTTTKALNPSTTLGDIEYRSATANTNTRLPIGTTGQVLTVSSGVPAWATPSAGGGGKVLQVVHANYATNTTSTSSSYADTGLTATITPSASTSKILVLVHQSGLQKFGATSMAVRLLRAGSAISTFGSAIGYNNSSQDNSMATASAAYLDSPATTSATIYKTQFANLDNTGTVACQGNSSMSTITLLEIGA